MNPVQKRHLNGLLLGTSCLVASTMLALSPSAAGSLPAGTLPTGGNVVAGSAKISQSGNQITQTSQKALIDWNTFSIGADETVTITGPNKNAVTVNRVTSSDPSLIYGQLRANDNVWLLNGNGILFGKGSIINVGSLIATTSDIADDDFRKGKYAFKSGNNPNASVINKGTIVASQGGSVVLSAAHVANEGVIKANLGKVVLGGANAFTVDMNGDNLIRYQVTSEVNQTPTDSNGDARKALVSNSGKIEANGGEVLMTSRAASNVQDNVINNSGIVQATSVSAHDGEVDFDAGPTGTVQDSGRVDVSGNGVGQTGGTVTMTGQNVTVADGAKINAQGYSGGGTVLIGGNFHGQGTLSQATNVTIGKATINANATHEGNGGKVAIWSKGNTTFDGAITARGGAEGGNGGYVETSGHVLSLDSGSVTTLAAKGDAGMWLIDPFAVEICQSGCNSTDSTTALTTAEIIRALMGGDVTIEAFGAGSNSTITVEPGATLSYGSANALSFLAEGSIFFDASVQNSANGDINVVAGWDGVTGITSGENGENNGSVDMGTILSTPGAYGNDNANVTIGYTGSSGVTISVGSFGGTTTVASDDLFVGVSGNTTANMQLGYAGAGGGDIGVYLTGNLTVQSDRGGYSQIGNGGNNITGDAGGNITITAGGNVDLDATDGNVQIGNGGESANGDFSGNIGVTADGAIDLEGGNGYAQIGNGGAGSNSGSGAGSDSGNITVQGASVSLIAGSGSGSYVQIGHGGDGSGEAEGSSNTGNIKVVATDGDIALTGGSSGDTGEEDNDYAQIGMGGPFGGNDATNKDTGNITVKASGNISLSAGSDADQQNGFALVGDSGTAEKSGNITVTAGGNISIVGGAATGNPDFGGLSNSFAMIGDDNQGDVSANVSVTAGGNLTLTGGAGNGNMAQIGSNGDSGDVTGNVLINVSGTMSIGSSQSGADAWIGNGYQGGGTVLGNVTLVTGDLNTSGDEESDLANFLGGDLVQGNVTVGITDSETDTVFQGLTYNSANAFELLVSGSLDIEGSIQNSGSGAIYVVGGWDGATTTASKLTNAGVYGNNGGSITIASEGNVSVGSESGKTVVAADDVTLDASDGIAQIGYASAGGSGNIVVVAKGDIDLSGSSDTECSNCYAQIGNGGNNAGNGDQSGNISLTAGGDISLTAGAGLTDYAMIGNGGSNITGNMSGAIALTTSGGDVDVTAGEDQSIATIGDLTSGGSSNESSDISVDTNGGALTLSSTGSTSYAQIGDWTVGGTNGAISGSTLIDAGAVSIDATGIRSSAQIGNGNYLGVADTGALSGNITVDATSVSLMAEPSNGGFDEARIGNLGEGTVTGAVNVTTAGDVTISATGGSAAVIGDFATYFGANPVTGFANASVTVDAGGAVLISADGSGSYASIEVGGAANGTVSVTAQQDVTLEASNGAGALIGSLDYNNGGVDISVRSLSGNVDIEADGNNSQVRIGNFDQLQDGNNTYSGGNVTGNISIKARNGNITVAASGNNAFTDIGNTDGGAKGKVSGNITFNSGGNFALTGTGGAIAQIGNGSQGENSASGNISLSIGGTTSIASDAGSTAWIGNLVTDGGQDSGSVSFITGDLDDSADQSGDAAQFILADLAFANFTLGFTDQNANLQIGALDYSSSHDLTIVAAGNLTIASSIQNSSNGSITVATGWNTSVAPSDVLTTAGAYGNNDSDLIIGGAAANGDVAIGSALGTTTVATHDLQLNAVNGSAQLGFAGNGSGGIFVDANGAIALNGGNRASLTAQIGDGANLDSSNASDAIVEITAASMDATGKNAIAGPSAEISITGNGEIGNASDAVEFAVNDLAIQSNGGNVFATSNTQGISLGLGTDGIDLNGGGFSLTADGTITQTQAISAGAVNVSGTAITLTNSANDFANASLTSSNDATLYDASDLNITGADVSGTLTLTGGGNIGQTGAITAGVLDVTASNGKINFSNKGNNFDSATLSSSGSASLYDASDLVITSADVGGTLTLGSGGDIDQTGAITAQALDAKAAHGTVVLTNADNTFADADLTASGDATLYDSSSLTMTGADVGGVLTLTTPGNIRQTGAMIAGTLNVTANKIALSNTGNSIGRATLSSSGDASLYDASDLTILAANIGGTLTLAGSGDIDQSGAITAQALNVATSNGSINLTNTGNSFADADVAASGDASLYDGPSLTVAGADVGGTFALTSGGDINQTGAIVAGAIDATAENGTIVLANTGNSFAAAEVSTSGDASLYDASDLTITGADVGGLLTLVGGGNIGQSGAITASTLDVTAGDGKINLSNTGNNFDSATLSSSGSASLYDASDLVITGADIGGTLTLGSGSNISQTGAIRAHALDATAAEGSVNLTNSGNAFADAGLTASDDATLYDASDLTMTGADVGGTLTLTGGGNIGQSGAIAAGVLDVTASHGAIALSNTGNTFGSATLSASGNASLYDASDMTITAADVGGTLTLAGGGDIGQSGAITANALDVTAANGSIVLTNAANTFADASLTASGNATLYDASALTITGANVVGTLALTSGGDINQTGAIVAGALNVTTANGGITLTNTGNNFAHADLNTSGDASLYDASDMIITGADVGGTLTLAGGGNIGQSGAITANALDVITSNGNIALANTHNKFASVMVASSGNAALYDASDLTVTGADVGGTLTLTGGGDVSQSGAITASALDVTAANGSITLTNSGNSFTEASLTASGDASLDDASALTITGANVGGTLTIAGGSNIGQSGAIAAGMLDVTASHGRIVLTNTENSFASATVVSSGSASLYDVSDLLIAKAAVGGTLTLAGGGDIGQTGAIKAQALDVTTANGSIALTNTKNRFADADVTASGDASFYDASTLTITGADVGGTLTLAGGGDIGQTGAITANALDVTAADGSITLTDTGNAFADADVTASGDASLYDASTLTIAGANIGGTLALASGGNIGQTGAIAADALDVTAVDGKIKLTNAHNAFNSATLSSSGSASLYDASDLSIAGADIGGTLTLAGGGDIVQTGAITANTLDVTTANGSITLANTNNSFADADVTASGSATLYDVSDLTITDADVGGVLALTSGGNVSQTGAIAAGALDVTAISGNITLTNTGNSFASATLDSSGDASLYDASDLTITGADVGGSLMLAGGGDIDQTGAIMAQTLDITAANGNVTLTSTGNTFGEAELTVSGNASLSDASDLTISSADVGGTLALTSGGNIDQTGAIAAGALDATALAGKITLTDMGNTFADADVAASGNASLYDASDLTITGADVGGTLDLSGGGNIGQSGAITAHTLNVTAANGSIALTDTANSVASASLTASGDASLYDASDLVITGADAGGSLTLAGGGNISQSGAITTGELNVTADSGGITLTNTDNSFTGADIVASGNASLYLSSDLTMTGADVGGTLTLTSGGNVLQSGAITAGALDVTAESGSITLTNTGNSIGAADLTTSGDASLYDASDLVITGANVAGTLTLAGGGDIGQSGAITADTLDVTTTGGSIDLMNTGNTVSSAELASSGDAALYIASGLTITGADVGGTLTLASNGDVGQTGAIVANGLVAMSSDGNVKLTNTGNTFSFAGFTASGNASLYDASSVTITGGDVGGTLTLTDHGDINESGALTAQTLDVTAKHGSIALTDTGNSFDSATLTSSGNAALYDASDLTVTAANIGGTLTLAGGGNIDQTGAITADGLNVETSSGNIVLTNTGNTFANAYLSASGNATLYDASALNMTGGDVSGTLAITSGGNIGQTGAIAAGVLNVTASNGTIALTDAGNAISNASLTSQGSATLYDSSSLTLANENVGGDLTLLSKGNLTFVSSVQLTNGNVLAIAGWDGTTTSASGLQNSGAYGNNGGSIIIGGTGASGGVAIGSVTGTTTLEGSSVSLEADNGYAQIGYNGAGSANINVLATQNVTLSGGMGAGDYAQIGNGGMGTSGNESGNITVTAGGAVALNGGSGQDAYAQIGHGGADADKNSEGYTNSGNITVNGLTVALSAGTGNEGYAQIGNGGFDLGDGLTGQGVNSGNITVTAVNSVSLTGAGTDAYAQIGNGGDQVNANAAKSAGGSNSGNITVTATSSGGSVSETAGASSDAYVQIGNGGFGTNASPDAIAANFTDTGTIVVSDLVLTGSNTGTNAYAQVGDGDASGNNVGDVSGDITIDAGTIVVTSGTAKGASAEIANATGDGTVNGTVTGYTGDTTSAATQGTVTAIVSQTSQSNTTPVNIVVTTPPPPPPPDTTTSDNQSSGPLEDLTGGNSGTDSATDELGQSLGAHKHTTQTVSLIPGVLTEVVAMQTPHGIPPADQDFSSWGNEALWRW